MGGGGSMVSLEESSQRLKGRVRKMTSIFSIFEALIMFEL